MPFELSSKFMRTLVYFSSGRNWSCIVFGSISPCLLFFSLPSIIRNFASVCDACRQPLALKTTRSRLYLKARANRTVAKCILYTVSSFRYSRLVSAEQLQYITKIVLLRMYGEYIEHIWIKLPEHEKTDISIIAATSTTNQPWHTSTVSHLK